MNILIDLNPNFLSFLFTGDRIANGISRNQGNKRSVKQIHPRIGTAKRWPWESEKVNFLTSQLKHTCFKEVIQIMSITVFLIRNVYDLFMYGRTIVQKSIPLPVNPIPV